MKSLRIWILCCLTLGIPLQGFAMVSQALCRMSQFDMGQQLPALASPHAAHQMHHMSELGNDMPQLTHQSPTLADAMHQCGHCAQCVAAHAMASFGLTATDWPQVQPVRVGAVPLLHGRIFTSAPERPPRHLSA